MPALSATLATPDDARAIHALLAAAGEQLSLRGFPNWLPAFPIERVLAGIEEQAVWLVRAPDDELVATYALRAAPAHRYEEIAWADPHAEARYLNRLAVAPAWYGQGVGSWCLATIADTSRQAGASAVRCDVLSPNAPLRRFYERAGYELRGERHHSGWKFAVYERLLDG